MTQRLPCTVCGELILSSTAERTGGLCMPCKGGYRKNIEAGYLRNAERRKQHQSPEAKHWRWLVDQSRDGIAQLSAANQAFLVVGLLELEVYNGGFESYFQSYSAEHHSAIVNALTEWGATNALRLLISAKEVMFGAEPVPVSTETRREMLLAIGEEDERFQKLNALDALYWKDPDKLGERADLFADRHGLRQGF
jgi:hypothetical protein